MRRIPVLMRTGEVLFERLKRVTALQATDDLPLRLRLAAGQAAARFFGIDLPAGRAPNDSTRLHAWLEFPICASKPAGKHNV